MNWIGELLDAIEGAGYLISKVCVELCRAA